MDKRGLLFAIGLFLITAIAFVLSMQSVTATITNLTLRSPDDDAWTNDNTTDFIFYVESDSAQQIDCTLYINNNQYGINNTVSNATITTITSDPIDDGVGYLWYINCTDDGGTNQSETRTINIDTTAPRITVISPENTTYNTNTIWFNATANETISEWIVNYNGTNVTLTDINTSLTVEDGVHHLLLYANDSANNFGLNDTIYFTVDTTEPDVTLTLSDYSIRRGDSITVFCNASDATSGVANVTVTSDDGTEICSGTNECSASYKPTTIGDKVISCTVYDKAGNVATDSDTLEVKRKISGGGTGGAGGGETTPEEPTQSEIDYNLGDLGATGETGKSFNAFEGDTFDFVLNGTKHKGKIDDVTTNSVTLWLWSEPIKVSLNVGETKQVDLNKNGYNDLEITLKGITNGKANLLFKELKEEIPQTGGEKGEKGESGAGTGTTGTTEGKEIKKNFFSQYWWVIVIVVVIVVVIVIYLATRKK